MARSNDSGSLTPGNYSVTEGTPWPAGHSPASRASSSLGEHDSELGTATALDLDNGETITCTFNDTQGATVTVVKEATPEGATSFDFDATGTGISPTSTSSMTAPARGDNDVVFTLTAAQLGAKTITENVPTGWSLTGVDCTGVTETANHQWCRASRSSPGATIVCTFNDSQDATVTVVKEATTRGRHQTSTSTAPAPGSAPTSTSSMTAPAPGDNDIVFTLTAAQLGAKTITETVPAGWS